LVTTRFTDCCRGNSRYHARWPATNRKIPLPASGRGLVLTRGRFGGDHLEPVDGVRLAERQRHHHPPGLVALSLPGLFSVVGDGHHRALHQPLDVLATACQQLA
jgi:hypothetical protein